MFKKSMNVFVFDDVKFKQVKINFHWLQPYLRSKGEGGCLWVSQLRWGQLPVRCIEQFQGLLCLSEQSYHKKPAESSTLSMGLGKQIKHIQQTLREEKLQKRAISLFVKLPFFKVNFFTSLKIQFAKLQHLEITEILSSRRHCCAQALTGVFWCFCLRLIFLQVTAW